MLELVDTHCHIHFSDYELNTEDVIKDAFDSKVTRLIAVGCTLEDSVAAVELAKNHNNIWASTGIHPHEAKRYVNDKHALSQFRDLVKDVSARRVLVAIGETGLDYHYMHSSKTDQIEMLKFQLEIGLEYNLPFIFHVREAFDDFWAIIDEYKGVRGVLHSFTSDRRQLDESLSRGLNIGLNGIITFSKDSSLTEVAKHVPLSKLLLETDAPFLTPVPFRGTICQPKHVCVVVEFLSTIRGESQEQIARQTTANAKKLFAIS